MRTLRVSIGLPARSRVCGGRREARKWGRHEIDFGVRPLRQPMLAPVDLERFTSNRLPDCRVSGEGRGRS